MPPKNPIDFLETDSASVVLSDTTPIKRARKRITDEVLGKAPTKVLAEEVAPSIATALRVADTAPEKGVSLAPTASDTEGLSLLPEKQGTVLEQLTGTLSNRADTDEEDLVDALADALKLMKYRETQAKALSKARESKPHQESNRNVLGRREAMRKLNRVSRNSQSRVSLPDMSVLLQPFYVRHRKSVGVEHA